MTMVKRIMIGALVFAIAGCAGSPAHLATMTPEETVDWMDAEGVSPERFCKQLKKYENALNQEKGSSAFSSAVKDLRQAAPVYMQRHGLDSNYCEDPERYSYIAKYDAEVYNIDTLRVTTETLKTNNCDSGGVHKIILEGTISPDSSFAMEKLLSQSPHCRNTRGQVIVATTVQLESGGGYLVDGYKLGRSLRRAGATTIIENQEGCASSCAVAFLGGKKRIVADTGAIMFHAPYFSGKNAYGEKLIDCDIPKADLQKLNAYYVEMVGKDAGDRIYERTMWYCSSEDGWVVTGGSAAELYDIATEK